MCTLCPRNCAVDRAGGERGICGQTEQLKVARAALHYWEEPCISGESGSGAVFFSGCALHCVFCQNRSIANGTAGKEITKERLAEIFLELQEKGANNINLVTPGHFAPQITEALRRAKAMLSKMDELGFGNCTNTRACEAECPKNISISNIARLNRDFIIAKLKD